MDPVNAITSAAPFWGPIVGVLLIAVGYLFRELMAANRGRLEDAQKHHAEMSALTKTGIENDKDQVHVAQAQNELIKAQDEKIRRIDDYIRSRPNV